MLKILIFGVFGLFWYHLSVWWCEGKPSISPIKAHLGTLEGGPKKYTPLCHELVPQGDRWIYLVQYASGSEAWNCIETDAMVFYSQNYSYKTMKQSAGRIDRRNTPYKNLYYYHLVSKSSIDNGIRNTLNKKKDFNESKFFAKLSREKNLAYNREKG